MEDALELKALLNLLQDKLIQLSREESLSEEIRQRFSRLHSLEITTTKEGSTQKKQLLMDKE